MRKVYLLCGSNMSERLQLLQSAKKLIHERIGKIEKTSSIYETAAWGFEEQEDFLNQALLVSSQLEPRDILMKIKKIESDLGRQPTVKWGPRTIDIDILFVDDIVSKSADLTIPHPEIEKRRFTLVPLAEIAADFIHPVHKVSVAALLARCPDKLPVTKVPVVNEI